MIPRDFIDQLISRIDIVDVINQRIPLNKAGQDYQACCPFHQEKTPSFTVSPTKQFYHCFGCGAHGSAISFLMEYSGLSFVDVVKSLAEEIGLKVPEDANYQPRTKAGPDLTELMAKVTAFYKEQLRGSERAINYLKKRGISGQAAARFGLGYAPAQSTALKQVFPNYGVPELAAAGLVIDSERGRYDRFRDRIMFPIRNTKGDVIAFGGRVLDQGEPKYMNSPETPIFHKGSEIYGLSEGRQAIRETGKILVVEGYMDVVALAQFDIHYAVATLGTATTPIQARTLLRQTDKLYYCFDGDNAGRKAAWRALENTLEALADGKEVFFLFLPEGEDPDTWVRNNGKEAFEKFMSSETVSLSAFLIRELSSQTDLSTQEGRAKLLKNAMPLLDKIAAPLLAALIRRELGISLSMGTDEVEALIMTKRDSRLQSQDTRSEMGAAHGNGKSVDRTLVTNHTPIIVSTELDKQKDELSDLEKQISGANELNMHAAVIRLAPPKVVLGIAVGIEAALAATELFDIPCWATINLTVMLRFEPPADTQWVMIFADKETSKESKETAEALGKLLVGKGFMVTIHYPPLDIPDGRREVNWLDYKLACSN